jgi:hypothetical protein
MKTNTPTRWKYLSLFLLIVPIAVASYVSSAIPQTRERTVAPNGAEAHIKVAEIIKTDVDLVMVDALVLQKNTARVVDEKCQMLYGK